MEPGERDPAEDRRRRSRGRRSPCCRCRGRRTAASAVRAGGAGSFVAACYAALHRDLRDARQRLAVLLEKHAASPTTKTSGCPGIERSGSTSTRPARSSGAPSDCHERRRRDAGRPDTVPASIRSPPSITPCASMSVTRRALAHLDAEPRERRRAASRSVSGNVASMVGPASTSTMRARAGRWCGTRRAASAARSRRARRPARRRSVRRRR